MTTIVALSTGSLPSGVAVIRISGPRAFTVVEALTGCLPKPRVMKLVDVRNPDNGEIIDSGLLVIFPNPYSFTGEDCAELQVHGSPAGVKAILNAIITFDDVVLAGPGDFTRRAFENNKLDLIEVDGLGDMLAAETEAQRRLAISRMQGGLSVKILGWRNILLDVRAEIEAHLDFSDEDDVPTALTAQFDTEMSQLENELSTTLRTFDGGRIIREGFKVVLVGSPNVGKSSLLNALAGSDVAIVTSEAGTTRDTKDVFLDIDGNKVIITDTAGIRETDSIAEAEGVKRAKEALLEADLILKLQSSDVEKLMLEDNISIPIWSIETKTDIQKTSSYFDYQISAATGEGIVELVKAIGAMVLFKTGSEEDVIVSHLRDRAALETALNHLKNARMLVTQPELCAEELRLVSDSLSRLIGLMDTEMVLDRLFAGFCIGK